MTLAELLTAVGSVITAAIGWGTSALTAIETAIATSILLQVALGIVAVFVGFMVLKQIVGVVKSFISKSKA